MFIKQANISILLNFLNKIQLFQNKTVSGSVDYRRFSS